MDAKDILGLPKGGPVGDKRIRAPKEASKKLDKVSREVYALTGGLPPLIPTVDIKQRYVPSKKISWQLLPFTNSARTDNLQLSHWVRVVDGVVPTGDYAFTQYNKSIGILKYTEEEYNKHLVDPNWSREETDLLFDLCERFDLRFIVIADRFNPERTVEELKQRFYSASKTIMLSRAHTPEDVAEHPHLKDEYNFNYEVDRKRALALLLSQSRQQDQEDEDVLAEATRITEARLVRAAEQAEAQLAKASSDPASQTTAADTSTAAAPSAPLGPRGHRVFLRGVNLAQMIQSLLSPAGGRLGKRVEQIIDELGVRAEPRVPTESICREHLELRKEILTLLNLQKQVQWKDTSVSLIREREHHPFSADVPTTPSTPKARPFRADAGGPRVPVGASGERAGKRDHKRKAPARFSEAPPSPPQQKRARKLKASAD